MKFKIGDVVTMTCENSSIKNRTHLVGKTGKITRTIKNCIGAVGKKTIDAYATDFSGEYIVYEDELSLVKSINNPVIVITTDGTTTTAIKRLNKKIIAQASTKCSPKDTFNFDVGAEIALGRLIKEPDKTNETKKNGNVKEPEEYRNLSNFQIYMASCLKGSCSAGAFSSRKKDCPAYKKIKATALIGSEIIVPKQ